MGNQEDKKENILYENRGTIIGTGIATLIAVLITCSTWKIVDNSIEKRRLTQEKYLEEENRNIFNNEAIALYDVNEDSLRVECGDIYSFCGKYFVSFGRSWHGYDLNSYESYYNFINNYIIDKNVISFLVDDFALRNLDFNNINMDNLKILQLDMRRSNGNDDLDLSCFQYRYYNELELQIDNTTNIDDINSLLLTLDLSRTYLNVNFGIDTDSAVIQEYLKILEDTPINRLSLLVACNPNSFDLTGIIAKSLSINLINPDLVVNYQFKLNDNVSNFDLCFLDYDDGSRVKLENITVNSNNNDLYTFISTSIFSENLIFDISEAEINLPDKSFCKMHLFSEDATTIIDPQTVPSIGNVGEFVNESIDKINAQLIYFDSELYDNGEDAINVWNDRTHRRYISIYGYQGKINENKDEIGLRLTI